MTPATRPIRKQLIIGIVSLIVIAGAYFGLTFWYNSTHLIVTNLQPKNNETAAAATPVTIWFNRPISADTAKNFSISPNAPGKVTVSGNSLTFASNSILTVDKTYLARLSHVSSADGKYKMGEFKFSFKIGEVPYDKQPKSVNDRAIALTDNRPPELAFFGDNELTNQGVTTDQLTNMETFMKGVFNKTTKTDYVININNVVSEPFDSNGNPPVQTYTFDMEMNDATYKARFDCAISGSSHLYVYDTTGKLIWDSGKLGSDSF